MPVTMLQIAALMPALFVALVAIALCAEALIETAVSTINRKDLTMSVKQSQSVMLNPATLRAFTAADRVGTYYQR